MKKIRNIRIMILLLLSIFTITSTVLAEEHAEFNSEDDQAYLSIYGEGSSNFQTDDYTFKDVTSKIKSDNSIMKKIEEYGTLTKAYELKINKTIDYSKYVEDIEFGFRIENNNKKIGLIRMTDTDKIKLPMENGHECEEDDCYYNYKYILGDGLFLIINPIDFEYKLSDEVGNIKFNHFKYANYTNNNLIFANLDKIIKNRNLIKTEAEKRGLNYDTIMDNYEDSDYALDVLEESKESIINGTTSNDREYLGTYGFKFVNPGIGIDLGGLYSISKFQINLKEDKNLEDYTDFNVYTINPYDYVSVDNGSFEEDEYYYYKDEDGDYRSLNCYTNGYMVGQSIDSEYTIAETAEYGYMPAYSKYFSSAYSYYVYETDGDYYRTIVDYNVGDLISEYGEPVYIYGWYKKTEDTTYQTGKQYIKLDDYGDIMEWLQPSDYYIGQDIAEFESSTGLEVYKEGMTFPELAKGLRAKNGYITFDMTLRDEEDTPIFIISGSKKVNYKKETEKGEISFQEKPNLNLTFKMDNIKDYSEESIKKALNLETEKAYNDIYGDVKNIVKNDLIEILNIEVKDSEGNEYTEGPFNIKIKMTDAMKKYKSFKLVNIKSENDKLASGDDVILKEENGYLVGTLNHLSVYALVGSQDDIENPNTGDSIIGYIILGSVSLVCLIGLGLYTSKKKSKSK